MHSIVDGDEDVGAALAGSAVVVEGEMRVGGQEHFYLETNAALCIPGEQGEMTARRGDASAAWVSIVCVCVVSVVGCRVCDSLRRSVRSRHAAVCRRRRSRRCVPEGCSIHDVCPPVAPAQDAEWFSSVHFPKKIREFHCATSECAQY